MVDYYSSPPLIRPISPKARFQMHRDSNTLLNGSPLLKGQIFFIVEGMALEEEDLVIYKFLVSVFI
jgi:hypothetical protein